MESRVQDVLRFLNREVGLETDERLRPQGAKGVLIPTREGFNDYVAGGMQAWEFLALWGRLRPLSRPAIEREDAVRAALESHMPPLKGLLEEASRMRRMQRDAAEPADIKRGRGGFADVEMLVYALSAGHGIRGGHMLRQPPFADHGLA